MAEEFQGEAVISIHAPRGGSDRFILPFWVIRLLFQSTLPVGGATHFCKQLKFDTLISIHAPRGGSDRLVVWPPIPMMAFQSTLPVGGATPGLQDRNRSQRISIHAPRGGSDLDEINAWQEKHAISIHAPRGGSDSRTTRPESKPKNFNPRSPWGERQRTTFAVVAKARFQSTLPVGGATDILAAVKGQ